MRVENVVKRYSVIVEQPIRRCHFGSASTGLRNTGGLAKKDRITHCVALTSLAEIDLQVKRWLRQAYERDG